MTAAQEPWAVPPPVLPPGIWKRLPMGADPRNHGIITRLASGMTISIADETYPPEEPLNGDPELVGTFRRVVFSYPHHYPRWEEMRDWLRGSGLFDRSRCVHLLLPPEEYYVNVHSFAMHWFQRLTATEEHNDW